LSRQTDSPRLAARSAEDLRVLAAACDMAVLRALELIGKRVARVERSRFGAMQRSGKEWHEAHTVWLPEPQQVDAALTGAWAVLPRLTSQHGCCTLVEPTLTALLDEYVRQLVFSGTPHSFEALERRLSDAVAES
jgi:hypothetical protein